MFYSEPEEAFVATIEPEIDIASVRVTPACLERWQRESEGRCREDADGSVQPGSGRAWVHVLDDGRLGVSCEISETMAIFLYAAPDEWWRV
jgi:hypothetical protein